MADTNTVVGSIEPVYILARDYSKVLEVILQETTLLAVLVSASRLKLLGLVGYLNFFAITRTIPSV